MWIRRCSSHANRYADGNTHGYA
jgi:hypothetical protein